MMNESAMTPVGSGLGLARTRVEAEMDLICDVEDGQLQVSAQARVTPNLSCLTIRAMADTDISPRAARRVPCACEHR